MLLEPARPASACSSIGHSSPAPATFRSPCNDERNPADVTAGPSGSRRDPRRRRPRDVVDVPPDVGLRAVDVGEPVLARRADRESTDCWFQRARSGSAASAATARPDVARRLREREVGRAAVVPSAASRQFSSVTPKSSSIISERSQPGREGDRGRAVRRAARGPARTPAGSPRPWPGRRRPRSGSATAL